MRNLYWIDSFDTYPEDIIHASVGVYDKLYGGYAAQHGLDFRFCHLEDFRIASGDRTMAEHREHGDILDQDCAAYVGLVHPDARTEKKQETLYRLLARSTRVRLLNHVPGFPMVCKDKFAGIDIARSCGLATPPTALVDGSAGAADIAWVERLLGPYPLFIRPRDLTGGMGAARIDDRAALAAFLVDPPYPGRGYIVQPRIAIRVDYRVYLERDGIVACRRREPLHGDLTTTIDGGGSCSAPEAIRAGSIALARYLGTEYLCVDWLYDGRDHWFCEFEIGGGFKDLDDVDRARVAHAFFGRARC
jgi:glutathione synthase/RimK-type ligase-like ATP-grasp enzyme